MYERPTQASSEVSFDRDRFDRFLSENGHPDSKIADLQVVFTKTKLPYYMKPDMHSNLNLVEIQE